MRGLNKVTLIGNLGQDPEVKAIQGDLTVTKFALATSESYRDKEGNLKTETEWHQVIAWRSLADLVHKLLQKGSRIYLEGKIKTRSYEDKDGNKKFVTEIIADSFILLDRPSDKVEINESLEK